MTQPNKKPSGQPTAKLANSLAGKAARDTYTAMESGRSSAENVVKIGGKAVQDFLATSAGEAQKAQEKAFAMGRESAEHFAKSADAATKVMYDAIGAGRGNIETCIECGNMTAAFTKDISSEVFEYTNKTLSDNLEMSKEFFACRTLSDMMELQNRIVKNSIDSFFNETVKLSGMLFEYSTEALEPINERVAQATEQFNKSLATA